MSEKKISKGPVTENDKRYIIRHKDKGAAFISLKIGRKVPTIQKIIDKYEEEAATVQPVEVTPVLIEIPIEVALTPPPPPAITQTKGGRTPHTNVSKMITPSLKNSKHHVSIMSQEAAEVIDEYRQKGSGRTERCVHVIDPSKGTI